MVASVSLALIAASCSGSPPGTLEIQVEYHDGPAGAMDIGTSTTVLVLRSDGSVAVTLRDGVDGEEERSSAELPPGEYLLRPSNLSAECEDVTVTVKSQSRTVATVSCSII